jgi:hypothetical protein
LVLGNGGESRARGRFARLCIKSAVVGIEIPGWEDEERYDKRKNET